MAVQEKTRVLVAEDDFLVCEEIVRILNQMDKYEHVGTVRDGKKAVEMTCSLQPDVVLMDIQMPNMDGLEATRQIQECCPTPVVVLTAYESKELLDRAVEVGVGAYLVKPPHLGDFERAIAIAIARHKDLMECRQLRIELESHVRQLESKNTELDKALAEIKTLRGFIPICTMCKKIRNDDGYWEQVETYICNHSEAEFTHALCPDCYEEERDSWVTKNNKEQS